MSGSLTDSPGILASTLGAGVDRGEFLQKAYAAARASGHVWPIHAACEAAHDSDFGTTELAINANNIFNLRAPAKFPSQMAAQIYVQTVSGRQYDWLKFRDWTQCFATRMEKLRRFGIYYQAIRAKTATHYVTEISRVWSSNPGRPAFVFALAAALTPTLDDREATQ